MDTFQGDTIILERQTLLKNMVVNLKDILVLPKKEYCSSKNEIIFRE